MTTWIGAQTTNQNRNIAGKKNLKSLPVAFFSQKFNVDFTVYAHKMARFQNCVMLFKMAARFPNIWALGVEWLLSSPPDLAGWVRSQVQTGHISPTVRSKGNGSTLECGLTNTSEAFRYWVLQYLSVLLMLILAKAI